MLIGITTAVNNENNLGRAGEEYVNCVCQSGAIPLLVPPFCEDRIDALLNRIDALILTGGSDIDPSLYHEVNASPKLGAVFQEQDLFEIALVRKAYELDTPVLGICRGMQLMNVAFGGSLYQDILESGLSESHNQGKPYESLTHGVIIEPKSLLGSILDKPHASTQIMVNSLHHQALREIASNFTVNAKSIDGIVEGIEDPSKTFFLGVQWHPEYLRSGQALFDKLAKAASQPKVMLR